MSDRPTSQRISFADSRAFLPAWAAQAAAFEEMDARNAAERKAAAMEDEAGGPSVSDALDPPTPEVTPMSDPTRVHDWTVWEAVRQERIRAHDKHGDTSMESSPADDPTGRRYRILAEEVGEVAKEFNDAEHDRRPVDLRLLRKELIQVAAMAGAWADACDPGGNPHE